MSEEAGLVIELVVIALMVALLGYILHGPAIERQHSVWTEVIEETRGISD